MKTRCAARQYSDQMHCQVCRLTWDTNDDYPPACGRAEPAPINVEKSGRDLLNPCARPLEFASGQPITATSHNRIQAETQIAAASAKRHIC